jgi:hypothetical protein
MINLRRISLTLNCSYNNHKIDQIIPSIISLKLSFQGSKNILIYLLKNFPNLICLIIKTKGIYLNGNEWKYLINNYLFKLKIFRFQMNFCLLSSNNIERDIDELLYSFRSSFWIEEHQWFIRCQWTQLFQRTNLILYSLPYLFDEFAYREKSISTCSNEEDFCSYNRVKILSYDDSINYQVYFSNIQHLTIKLPFQNHFWSIIPSLNKLNSLSVQLNDKSDYILLQSLLDKASNLYSLIVKSKSPLENFFFQLKNSSIRRLDFDEICQSFSSIDCQLLVNSSIGYQCQVLFLIIENSNDIIYLIEKLINLRKLIFTCKDDRWDYFKSLPSPNDTLMQWLQACLPTIYSIQRDLHHSSRIHIWK